MAERDTEIAGNLTNPVVWGRVVFMLLFAVVFYFAVWVGAAVTLIQLGFKLVSGKPVPRLSAFGASLGHYLRQITAFETFGSEQKPWPMMAWPSPTSSDAGRNTAAGSAQVRRTRVVKTAARQAQDEKS
ncbi:MAG: DUF4389 domain-containing protein [Proteobacteria bacterium]|nr:DUF4389 domain-containing protein [Pseudomonadota bacterium]MDA1057452.1 DUF4389 domain-containing protein [Pseudomonadota bacterium]